MGNCVRQHRIKTLFFSLIERFQEVISLPSGIVPLTSVLSTDYRSRLRKSAAKLRTTNCLRSAALVTKDEPEMPETELYPHAKDTATGHAEAMFRRGLALLSEPSGPRRGR